MNQSSRILEYLLLGLIFAVLVFAPLAFGAVGTREFLVVQALTMLATLLWCVRFVVSPSLRFGCPPVGLWLLIFAAYAASRYLVAPVEYLARAELVRVLVYTCWFFVVLNTAYRRKAGHFTMLVLVAVAGLLSGWAVYQVISHSGRIWNVTKPAMYLARGSGSFINPNHLAGFLELVFPLGLAFTLVSRFNYLGKIVLGYFSLVILVGIGVTFSRGGWVATGFVLLTFLFVYLLQFRARWRIIPIAVLLLGVITWFGLKVEYTQKRFQNISGDIRPLIWRAAYRVWQDHPVWGAGPGHFPERFRQYRHHQIEVQVRPQYVHNDYLQALVDWGAAGAAILLAGAAAFFLGVRRTWLALKNSHGKRHRIALLLGGTLGLTALLVHAWLEFNFQIPANAIAAITVLALVTSCRRKATDRDWIRPRWWVRILLVLPFLGIAGMLSWTGLRHAREAVLLRQAQRAPEHSPARLQFLEKAFALEPHNARTAYAIGEHLRIRSWRGESGYAREATQAMQWFDRAMKANPLDPFAPQRYGMCLDWIGQTNAAQAYFERGYQLDPLGYYTLALQGWHAVQMGDYFKAKEWFDRSLRLEYFENPIARSYSQIVADRLRTLTNAPAAPR